MASFFLFRFFETSLGLLHLLLSGLDLLLDRVRRGLVGGWLSRRRRTSRRGRTAGPTRRRLTTTGRRGRTTGGRTGRGVRTFRRGTFGGRTVGRFAAGFRRLPGGIGRITRFALARIGWIALARIAGFVTALVGFAPFRRFRFGRFAGTFGGFARFAAGRFARRRSFTVGGLAALAVGRFATLGRLARLTVARFAVVGTLVARLTGFAVVVGGIGRFATFAGQGTVGGDLLGQPAGPLGSLTLLVGQAGGIGSRLSLSADAPLDPNQPFEFLDIFLDLVLLVAVAVEPVLRKQEGQQVVEVRPDRLLAVGGAAELLPTDPAGDLVHPGERDAVFALAEGLLEQLRPLGVGGRLDLGDPEQHVLEPAIFLDQRGLFAGQELRRVRRSGRSAPVGTGRSVFAGPLPQGERRNHHHRQDRPGDEGRGASGAVQRHSRLGSGRSEPDQVRAPGRTRVGRGGIGGGSAECTGNVHRLLMVSSRHHCSRRRSYGPPMVTPRPADRHHRVRSERIRHRRQQGEQHHPRDGEPGEQRRRLPEDRRNPLRPRRRIDQARRHHQRHGVEQGVDVRHGGVG